MPLWKKGAPILIFCVLFGVHSVAFASAPSAGGDTTVVSPSDESAVSITEDAVQPESANIRLIVPTLSDPSGGTPNSIRILSVTGGTLWQNGGSSITLGASGTALSLSSSRVDLRFRPDAGCDTDATFQYVVVDPHDSNVNSAASTATISITAVNDAPALQTSTGSTGIGLAATYYINSWDLTGSTYKRIDSTINFSNNFAVPGFNADNFSARWTGKVQSPITGSVTFSTSTDDGVRLWIDGNLIIDNWTLHGETVDTASPVSLVSGQQYDIRMEFYERGGGEVAKLRWAYSGQSTQIIPQTYLFPAITRPAMSYVNGSSAVIIDDAVTVSDVDSANITSATIEISANYQSDEDELQFVDQNGITGSYSNGLLTLSGSASLANYQTALRSVKYYNSDPTPTNSTRTIEFTVSDGTDESNSTYRDINFSGVNNPPVITEGDSVSVTMDEDSTPTAFALTLNATDADYHSITWSIGSQAAHGTASASGTGDSKDINYIPTADYYGSDSFVVSVSDGAGGTDTITVNITITDRTAPIISAMGVSGLSRTGATISWTTDENTSSQVLYGLAEAYDLDTGTSDTSPRVLSHSVTLSDLSKCKTYYYKVVSEDAFSNATMSEGLTFRTSGCVTSWSDRTPTVTETADPVQASTPTSDPAITEPADRETPATVIEHTVPAIVPENPSVCTPYIRSFIKFGVANDPEDVRKLETFLNEKQGESVPVDGVYSQEDVAAVKRFQQKYASDVLGIWGLTKPTGYVYRTTLIKINSFYCNKDIACPAFAEFNSPKENATSPEVEKTKILLSELGFYTGVIDSQFDADLSRALKNFQETFSEAMLKPWGFKSGTGYKYKTTNKFLNLIAGCKTPAVTLEGRGTFDY